MLRASLSSSKASRRSGPFGYPIMTTGFPTATDSASFSNGRYGSSGGFSLAGLLEFQGDWLRMVRKESHELLQPRLAVNFAIQALRALISEPGLGDMAVGDDVAVADVEPGARKFIFRNRTAALRSQHGIIVSALNRLAGFVCLGLGIT